MYNKLNIFKVCSSMSFDLYTPGKPHPSQDSEHFHHSKNFLLPLHDPCIPQPQPQAPTDALSVIMESF